MTPLEQARALLDGLCGLTGEPDEVVAQATLLEAEIADAIEKAEARGRAAGLEGGAKEVERLMELYDETSSQRSLFAAIARHIRALADPSPAVTKEKET